MKEYINTLNHKKRSMLDKICYLLSKNCNGTASFSKNYIYKIFIIADVIQFNNFVECIEEKSILKYFDSCPICRFNPKILSESQYHYNDELQINTPILLDEVLNDTNLFEIDENNDVHFKDWTYYDEYEKEHYFRFGATCGEDRNIIDRVFNILNFMVSSGPLELEYPASGLC